MSNESSGSKLTLTGRELWIIFAIFLGIGGDNAIEHFTGIPQRTVTAIEDQTEAISEELHSLNEAFDSLSVVVQADKAYMRGLSSNLKALEGSVDSLALNQLKGFSAVDGYLKALSREDDGN